MELAISSGKIKIEIISAGSGFKCSIFNDGCGFLNKIGIRMCQKLAKQASSDWSAGSALRHIWAIQPSTLIWKTNMQKGLTEIQLLN